MTLTKQDTTQIVRIVRTETDDIRAAVARLEVAQEGTQAAVSRLETAQENTQAAVSRLENVQKGTQAAVVRLEAAQEGTQAAVARLEVALEGTQSAVARLEVGLEGTQAAVTRLGVLYEEGNHRLLAMSESLDGAIAQKRTVDDHQDRITGLEHDTASIRRVVTGHSQQIGGLKRRR